MSKATGKCILITKDFRKRIKLGIKTGVVNCFRFNPLPNQFWLMDYRIFHPEQDGKSNIDHFQVMLKQFVPRQISYQPC